MKALILTGPHDGEFTDHGRPILEFIDPACMEEIPAYTPEPEIAEPPPLKILTFKRVTFYDGWKYVDLYVPYEWPDVAMKSKVLGYFLNRAFKDAAK